MTMIETPTEKQFIDISKMPAIKPGEPMLQIAVNGKVLSFPVGWTRVLLFHWIPEYMRDSTVPFPKPAEETKEAPNTHMFELMRSGIKNMTRPFLGFLLRSLYGRDETRWPADVRMPKGREDTLPVIDRMLIDFIVTQAYFHPIGIEYDEATGFVTNIRPGQRMAPTVDTGNAAGASGEKREGRQAAG